MDEKNSCVFAYKPFWGCISNRALSRKYGKFLEGNLPTTVHWMNYWSEDIIRAIGMETIQNVIDKNTTISFKRGMSSHAAVRNSGILAYQLRLPVF